MPTILAPVPLKRCAGMWAGQKRLSAEPLCRLVPRGQRPLETRDKRSLRAAQSRCLYNIRQAFRIMQADLDPLSKGERTTPTLQTAWPCRNYA